MRDFIHRIADHPTLGRMLAHRRSIPASDAIYGTPSHALPVDLSEALTAHGIERLFRHQAEGLDRTACGRNVLVATPTASGKTLLFAASVLRTILEQPGSRALILYPTKALARDQLAGFRLLAGGLGALHPPRFEIYDGDTSQTARRRIKADPPDVLITNPDMLHMAILAHHDEWTGFLAGLRWVVLDELHVYRGIFGAHVHHILARLRRLCEAAGASPGFIAASATVGNPGQFAETLVGQPFDVIDRSGAPSAAREFLFLNPVGVSPYTTAVRVLAETLDAGLRTIAFAKARRVTELLYTWLVQQHPQFADRVAPYRAGYLPEERRRLETRLFRGELSAVLSTSALELGIDVGGLDACILVGYPGSRVSSWQRIGRVGRRDRDGLIVLIALPDALDQYLMHHPEHLFEDTFERAVLDPWNPEVAGRHLACAAAERPLELDEMDGAAREAAGAAVRDGLLVQDGSGRRYFSFRRRPQRDVNPRSAGAPFAIVDKRSNRVLGAIDGNRVYHECHPGAVYLHAGQSYQILDLDTDKRRVVAMPARLDHYTVVQGEKETEILERLDGRSLGPFPVGLGRFKVTVRIQGYQKKRLFDGEPISTHPLTVPPLSFETTGLWIELPAGLPAKFTERGLHFMGGIHATEHATIGLFPLLAIADRGDIGGISYTGHPQIGGPAVFIYDAVPGGAGLARRGFDDLEILIERTLDQVRACPCEDGCPSCIQSPRCGNGNKPLDKAAAVLTLRLLHGEESLDALGVAACPASSEDGLRAYVSTPAAPDAGRRHGVRRGGNVEPAAEAPRVEAPAPPELADGPAAVISAATTVIFDLETQRSAADVGGWSHPDRMGLALAVVYDVQRRAFRTYYESDVDRLLLQLVMADRVVGFNLDRFDIPVLSAYTEWDLKRIRTFDLLSEIHARLGFRLSLAHLSEVNLGESKGGDGLQSLEWWKQGRIDLIEQYCRKDVDLTRRIYELGARQGYLLYRDHQERTVRLPVDW